MNGVPIDYPTFPNPGGIGDQKGYEKSMPQVVEESPLEPNQNPMNNPWSEIKGDLP